MLLLQFSTSHYCRKARLALGYKGINYQVENLTPGVHIFRVKPLTGLSTLPVLLPQEQGQPRWVGDSTLIFKYLEQYCPQPSLIPPNPQDILQAWLLEDWLDESIGTATRFVYYNFRAGEGKSLDSSFSSQLLIQVVLRQYGITEAAVTLAKNRLATALEILAPWQERQYLVGNQISVADVTAAALLSPLALIPQYRQGYPWLFERIKEIHQLCGEPLPPGVDN